MATAKSPSSRKPSTRATATKSSARKTAPAASRPAKTAATKSPVRGSAASAARKTPARRNGVDHASTASKATKARRPSRAARKEMSHIDRVWELAERIGICMFITWDGERQRARPLAAHVDRKAHAIDFLTDVDGHKDDQIEKFPVVSLAFADGKKNRYVAITGRADISNDRARIKKLWSPWAKAWWDSPQDPKIRVIRVTPEDAELWDSPGRVAATVAMLAAALTGKPPKLLDTAKLETI